ncbi:MAG: alanyl-tRNA editing protein [Gemmatimonadetes bacterium]|nr:alanyl-tRNA editing protein [Gemmatimonadota bacterium]
MTNRLYYTDTYLRTFDATIVERADDGRRLYLDRSAFYPTSGGQPHDRGTLGGVDVIDVVDEEERVAHVLAAPYAGPDAVHGAIDWPRRWDFVQQHTGQHLLSGTFEALFDMPTVSVHFGDALSTLELRAPALSPAQLRRVEEHANALVAENRPVIVTFEDAEAVAARLRRPSMRTGTLRIVTIEGHDVSACGGTHVRATGEIGALLLRRVEKIRDNVRIEFVCGARAIRRARADYDALSGIAMRLSASVDEVAPLVQAQADEAKALASVNRKLTEEVAGHRARIQWEAATPGADGVRRLRGVDGMSSDELRAWAAACAALPATVAAGAVRSSRTIAAAVSADLHANAGALLKEALQRVGGRGGGSPRTAQGTVPEDGHVDVVLSAVLDAAYGPAAS